MGWTADPGPGSLSSPGENPFPEHRKQHKKYQSGRWLTNNWVTAGKVDSICVAFSTNKRFRENVDGKDNLILMESDGDHDYAWQTLYPVDQLIRQETKHGGGDIGRTERPQPEDV